MNLAKVILVVDIAINFLSFSFDTPCISVYNLGNNAKSHWGKYCVLHRTSKKKLKMKREAIKKWLWEHMHESIKDTIEALNVKLTGHYRYYGIYGNYVSLQKFYNYVLIELWKSKRRRDQTNWLTWNKYINILKIHPLECPKIYLNSAY